MGNFSSSPLFQRAAKALRQTAQQEFLRTDFGRLLREMRRVGEKTTWGPGDAPERFEQFVRRWGSTTPQQAIRQIMGSEFGEVVRQVRRYSQGGSMGRKVIGEFLASLGPAGKLINAIATHSESIAGGKRGSIQANLKAAADFLRAFGAEALLPKGRGSLEDVNRGIAAAQQYLNDHAPELIRGKRPGIMAGTIQPQPGRKTVDVPIGQRTGRFAPNHPVVTGEMIRVGGSSNVWEYGYDIRSGYLYIRFAAHDRNHRVTGPGSLYRYSGISPDQFVSLMRASSKGDWIWDVLRIRGTQSGHHYDYELVGVTGDYVPRKSTVAPLMRVGPRGGLTQVGVHEIYLPRQVRSLDGKYLMSSRPLEPVTPLPAGHVLGPIGPRGPNGGTTRTLGPRGRY